MSLLFLVTCVPLTSDTPLAPPPDHSVLIPGADKYYFAQKEFQKKRVTITIVLYKNYEDLAKVANKNGLYADENEYIVAFSSYTRAGKTCTIHMVDPAVIYQPEFTGHEMLHCFFGQFHLSNDSKG